MNQRYSKCRLYFETVLQSQLPDQTTQPSSTTNIYAAPLAPPGTSPPSFQSPEPFQDFPDIEMDVTPEPQNLELDNSFYKELHPQGSRSRPIDDKGLTFLELFDKDEYAEQRTGNLYFPFASEEEWQLAAFLLKSGLSMSSVGEFLKLKLVSVPYISLLVRLTFRRLTALDFHSKALSLYVTEQKNSHLVLVGSP